MSVSVAFLKFSLLISGSIAPRAKALTEVCDGDGPARAASKTTCSFSVIRDASGLRELMVEWRRLYREAAHGDHFFLSAGWIEAWARHYADAAGRRGPRLAIVVGRRSGRLVLALPLAVQRAMGVTKLVAAGLPVSQYSDVLVSDEVDAVAETAAALWFAIAEARADVLELKNVRDDSVLAEALSRFGARKVRGRAAPYIDLAPHASQDDYLAQFSRNSRKQRNRRRRQLAQLGEVGFETMEPGCRAAMTARAAIGRKRQALIDTGQLSTTLTDERFEAFFVDVVRTPDPDAPCVVSVLSLDGRPVAEEIGIRSTLSYAAHIGVIDADLKRYAPGILQIDDMVGSLIAQGMERYDLLAPNDAYKEQFASGSVGVCDYAKPITLKGRVFVGGFLRFAMPLAYGLKARLPKSAGGIIARVLARN